MDDIISSKEKSTIYLSGANAKWLDANDNSFFIKKYLKKALSKKKLQFTIGFIYNEKDSTKKNNAFE